MKCDLKNPYSLKEGEMTNIKIPVDSEFISIQVIYSDGTESEVKIYPKKNHMMGF